MMPEREVFPSLTGLRFVLAVWISLYHLAVLYAPPALAHAPWVEVGQARVDIFFVLSGFVLTHVYTLTAKTPFHFGKFMAARIGRLYPLHLLGLTILGIGIVGAYALGRGAEASSYSWQGLVGNLLMLQAWGFPGVGAWNFPAWTLSAEFTAYLVFPLLAMIGLAMAKRPIAFWTGVLVFIAAADFVWAATREDNLAQATQYFGAVRGVLCFSAGLAMRFVFERAHLNAMQSVMLVVAGAVIAGFAAISGESLAMVAAGASVLIVALAALDRAGARTPLAGPVMQELGRWSYALFVLHIPIYVLGERALNVIGWNGDVGAAKAFVLFAVAFIASAPAHHWVEEPARKAIRAIYDRHWGGKSDQKPFNVAN
jgi:peptidoglycan/LPS O-acetylase OafA/YrhL